MTYIHKIKTKDDLILFVLNLVADYRESPNSWENATLDSFLEALAAYLEDIDGFYRNQNREIPDKPTWGYIADLLMGAKYYE